MATAAAVGGRQLPQLSDSSSDSDGGGGVGSNPLRHVDLSGSIFKPYFDFTGQSTATDADLSKIQSFLNSSSSGALSCLICLERIRLSDPTWSCSALCFSVFHLVCIQSWARQSSDLAAARAATRLSLSAAAAAEAATWHCPKCRSEYTKTQIPKSYLCFCGKLENPSSDDPWILPHSCGEVCGRPLRYNCGHNCLLLCHPGPCPPCPKVVASTCFCGSVSESRRCGAKKFACSGTCSKLLDCGVHLCTEKCHDEDCPPCRKRGTYKCQCGKVKEERECCERIFRCEKPCDKLLDCGKHKCGKGCHSGECGGCPFKGKRSCPCGKKVYEGMACDVAVPLCGGTCDKVLTCGYHRCPERCHRGQCIETCRRVVVKSCRCGSSRKEVLCYQNLTCERKCLRMRDCGRHACKRRCCDGDCPPCTEVCDRKLRCNNHKCPSPCHRGACAPCPVMVTISCACGETKYEVPCGTEMDQKPPRCRKPCNAPSLCRHAPYSKPHRCHYGACTPCRLLCNEEYQCGHKCKLKCHGPKPPPHPEFTVRPRKKQKFYRPPEPTPGSPCPPCPELVIRSCVGQHEGAERTMVCSDKTRFSCDNLCGNPLPCGNHYCTKVCHPLSGRSSGVEACEECSLPCEKKRKPECQHLFPLPCHPGDCPPCKVLVKRSCHCGSMVHVFECIYYNFLSKDEQMTVRSCGGPCHRKLPYCTHLCPETCHPGECPQPEKCSKKVTVRCSCHTFKKEWICEEVQSAYRASDTDPKDIAKSHFGHGLLPCDSECRKKIKTVEPELHHRKSTNVAEEKESDTGKSASKRRRRREKVQEAQGVSKLQRISAIMKRFIMFVFLAVVVIAVTYFGYKGLLWLNSWMNEIDKQRSRRPRRL